MAKRFTTQELNAAHNVARNNADKEAARAATESTIVEPVDPARAPQPFPYTGHPFGNNDNNRRVAERIARENALVGAPTPVPAPQTAGAAAQADLSKAADFTDDGDGADLTEEQAKAALAAQIAAIAGGATPDPNASPLVPVPPAAPPAWNPKA